MSDQLWIDLRSDTVTRPTEKMRAAMSSAEVGDDVYGEDPTVNRLERRAAEIFGKEAALFVPTGTMGNSIALKVHTNHGEEVICATRSHIVDWELSMMAWFAGCLARPIPAPDGILTWDQIEPVLRSGGTDNAPTSLICLENTHNMAGGTVYPLAVIDEICAHAHARKLKVHVDGARIYNASVALGVSVARIAEAVDSVMFCLSKGLGAPVGSMFVSTAEAVALGRLLRKRLGGGMRQAALAAAGLIALEDSPRLLMDDHANARFLAEQFSSIPGISIDLSKVQTNIVMVDVSGLGFKADQLSSLLKARGVLANPIGPTQLRLVTHSDVSRPQCQRAIEILSHLAQETAAGAMI